MFAATDFKPKMVTPTDVKILEKRIDNALKNGKLQVKVKKVPSAAMVAALNAIYVASGWERVDLVSTGEPGTEGHVTALVVVPKPS